MWRLLLSLLPLVAAQNASVYSFSGSFSASAATMATIRTSTSTGLCENYYSGYYYTTFPVSFATAGFRTLLGFSIDFVGFVPGNSIALNTSYPCDSTPALFPLVETSMSTYGPQNMFGHYFAAGNYTFVVASYRAGDFGGEFWEGMYNGQTSGGDKWQALYDSTGCTAGSSSVYSAQRIMVATTGYYSMYLAFGQNTTAAPTEQIPYDVTLTVLSGDWSAANLTTADCAAVGTAFVGGKASSSGSTNVFTYQLHLEAGMNYTIVASAGDTPTPSPFLGRYSVVVTPDIYIPFSSLALFSPPVSPRCDGTFSGCTSPNPFNGQNYAKAEFNVPANSWFYLYTMEVTQTGAYEDLAFYLYSEHNSNLLSCGSYGGATCIKGFDSLTGTTFYSGSATNFTIIATNWYDNGVKSEGLLQLFIMKGNALPSFARTNSPTTPWPTAAPTAPTTTAPSAQTTSAPTAPTTMAPSTSGVTSAPSTSMPTVQGQTYAPTTKAPTTRMPTVQGQTYAPTTAVPTDAPGNTVGAAATQVPCLALALALALCH